MQTLLDNFRIIAYAVLLALVLRIFLFQPFSIPSGSMIPTLLIGDFLFVSKYSYGYSRFSLPFSPPLFEGRLFAKEPKRGDISVFKLPADGKTDFIKRIIGLPGDQIQVIDGIVHINGVAVQRQRIEDFIRTDRYGVTRRIPRYRETLPSGVSYDILDRAPKSYTDNTPIYSVPENAFFVMGDNRDDSVDSRFRRVGFVPYDNLVGRAELIFFSYNWNVLSYTSLLQALATGHFVRWRRIGDLL